MWLRFIFISECRNGLLFVVLISDGGVFIGFSVGVIYICFIVFFVVFLSCMVVFVIVGGLL